MHIKHKAQAESLSVQLILMNISFDVPYFSFMLLILNECKEIDLALGCFQLIIRVLIQ
jgi:hypothetical protein